MMQRIARFLEENADTIAQGIMQDWHALGEREPWHRIPENLDQDHLPDMIRALARTALAGFFEKPARQELVDASVTHGEHRYQQGVAEEILAREFELLRWALWRRLKGESAIEDASQGIIRLDSALTLAHGASLRGYHRREIEAAGDWNEALRRYIEEWSFPQ
jgi:hypothetical protein